jgi:hypothetical protein
MAEPRPDVEADVIAILKPDLDPVPVKAAFDPVEDEPLPVVLVHRAGGGSRAWPHVLDEALIGLDVYAPTKAEAWDLMAAVLERLTSVDGESVNGEWLSAVEDAGSTLWLPDAASGRSRYSAVVRVYARGESAVPAP